MHNRKTIAMATNRRNALSQTISQRHGIATVWILLCLPAIVTLFCFVVDIGNVWLARIELANAAEAAAQAAAITWGEGSTPAQARQAAQIFANANTVIGEPVILDANERASNTNGNKFCTGDILLGAISPAGSLDFNACIEPVYSSGANTDFAVIVRTTVPVKSLFGNIFGISIGTYEVSASSVACYRRATEITELIRLDDKHCQNSCL